MTTSKDNCTVYTTRARNFEEFGASQKTVVQRGLTVDAARKMCLDSNRDRTQAQVTAGLKYEYTSGEVR